MKSARCVPALKEFATPVANPTWGPISHNVTLDLWTLVDGVEDGGADIGWPFGWARRGRNGGGGVECRILGDREGDVAGEGLGINVDIIDARHRIFYFSFYLMR